MICEISSRQSFLISIQTLFCLSSENVILMFFAQFLSSCNEGGLYLRKYLKWISITGLVYFKKYGNLEIELSHSFPKLLEMELKFPHPCPPFLQTG